MTPNDPPSAPSPPPSRPQDPRIVEIAAHYVALLEEGDPPDLESFLALQPPELRDELRANLAAVLTVKRVLATPPHGPGSSDLTGKSLGEFELRRVIGSGGMGVVYLAWQPSLRRHVALKVLPPALAAHKRRLERFLREATSEGRLTHPNIVRVYETGQEGETYFFAMEWMEGGSLHERLEERRRLRRASTGKLGSDIAPAHVRDIVTVVAEIADALGHAHAHGVFHRDVKPHNILFDEKGSAHLADFGLAKDIEFESLSKSGEIAGTPYYLSPEQALARRARIDHRTDIYSLGVVLYEALSLHRPFDGDTHEKILLAITRGDPIPLRRLEPRVPRDLETICHKALERSPDRRYATAADLASDLRRFLGHESIVARPPTPLDRAQRFAWKHRVPIAAGLLLAAGSAVGAGTHRSLARNEQIARALTALREPAGAPLPALPLAEFVARHCAAEQAATLRDPMTGAERAELDQRRAALAAERDRRRDDFLARMRRGLFQDPAGVPFADYTPQDDILYFEALRDTAALVALFPDDPEVTAWREIDATFPRLTLVAGRGLEANLEGATVELRPIDARGGALGAARSLGRMPIAARPVPPGFWRIVVRKEGVGVSELTRYFVQRARDHVLTVWLRPDGETKAGLKLVPAGPFTYGMRQPRTEFDAERTLELPAFWIGRCEVSLREYVDFLAATGRPRPADWPADPPADRLDLPVAWLSHDEATAYAEFRGLRLPTVFEWEKAARGNDGRRLPWADASADARALANIGVAGRPLADGGDLRQALWRDFLDHAWPVDRELRGAESPYGLLHVVGNVAEWTESMDVQPIQGAFVPMVHHRLVKGGSWNEHLPVVQSEGVTTVESTLVSFVLHDHGFRCARSQTP